ncbi:MAG: hypothetical protein AAFO09_09215, partial [Pseudomonadota bacterium]
PARRRQSQELDTQGFANNLGHQRLTQVEANVRSDTEESHSAGFNQSDISSNSNTLLHGQIDCCGDALAGTETTTGGRGQGLSQTQNETLTSTSSSSFSTSKSITTTIDLAVQESVRVGGNIRLVETCGVTFFCIRPNIGFDLSQTLMPKVVSKALSVKLLALSSSCR